jgi:hypothetical protein
MTDPQPAWQPPWLEPPYAIGWPELKGHWRRWFHEYNPLYFFSALCVLAGIFLISDGLQGLQTTGHSAWGQIGLFAALQLYELMLVGGALILCRFGGERRPAVILLLMELFFLYDCTFRLESIANTTAYDWLLAGGWIGLCVAKLRGLQLAFRLQVSWPVWLAGGLGALGIAVMPYLLAWKGMEKTTTLYLLNWYGVALIAGLPWLRAAWPRVTTLLPLDPWGETVLRRTTIHAWISLGGFYFYHVWNYILWVALLPEPKLLLQISPLMAMVAWCAPNGPTLFLFGAVALFFTLGVPTWFSPTAFLLVLLLLRQWRRISLWWVKAGGVACLYAGLWGLGWDGHGPDPAALAPLSWKGMLVIAVALGLIWHGNRWVAIVVAVAGAAYLVEWPAIVPPSSLGAGILLLAVGFVALPLGIAINWALRPRPGPDTPVESGVPSPETSPAPTKGR